MDGWEYRVGERGYRWFGGLNERGVLRKEEGILHVPTGTLIAISVATLAVALAFTTTSLAAYKSWPAAYKLPFVGGRAFSLRSWTWRISSGRFPLLAEVG